MKNNTKLLLEEALFIYDNAPRDEKPRLVKAIEDNLARHELGLKIGFGCEEDKVAAGLIFLRIVKNKNRP